MEATRSSELFRVIDATWSTISLAMIPTCFSGHELHIEIPALECLGSRTIDKLKPQARTVNGKSPTDQAQTLPNAGKVGSGGTHWAVRRD